MTNQKSKIEKIKILQLAKKAIKTFLKTNKIINPPKPLPKLFQKKAGVFVSLHLKNDSLRGCIGTFLPAQNNLAQEIINNAISAATKDPRFEPLTKKEYKNINISVDVLSKLEPVKNFENLNPKKYGIIVKSNSGATGLLLPDLPQIDTPEKQIAIACQKAGIPANEPISLFKFSVKRYNE